MIVSGGTGTGKTTLLNVLSSFIPEGERIVTIEDAVELQLQQDHVVRLESRPPNIEGKGAITIRDLVRNSLRMRPDRIVVGECRGGESLDMLQAMNTGHDGSLSTVHANSPRDAIARLETLVLMAGMDLPLRAIREQIASAVDVVVQLTRLRDGTRRVTHVTEVQGMEGETVTLQDAFLFDYSAGVDAAGKFLGKPVPTGVRPRFTDRFDELGITLSPRVFGAAEPAGVAGLVLMPDLLVVGLVAVAAALLLLALVVAARPGRAAVPLSPARPDGARRRRVGAGRRPGPPPARRWRRCWSSAAGWPTVRGRAGARRHRDAAARLRARRRRCDGRGGGARRRCSAARSSACCSPRRRRRSAPGCCVKFRAGRRAGARSPTSSTTRCSSWPAACAPGTACCARVDSVSQDAAAPTSEEFSRIVNETRVGRDLGDALDEVADAHGQRRLHLGRPGDRHPPRGGRQPGRGARRGRAHHPRAQRDPPPGQGAVGRGQAVGDRADGAALRRSPGSSR